MVLRGVLPYALEWIIPWAAKRNAGVVLELDNIDFGLFQGLVRVEGLRAGLPTGADPEPPVDPETALLRFDGLELDLEWMDLFFRRAHLRSLILDAPTMALTQLADGRLLLPEAPSEPEADAVPESNDEASAEEAPAHQEAIAGDGPAEGAESDEPGWEVVLDALELNSLAFRLHHESVEKDVLTFGFERFSLADLVMGSGEFALGGVDLVSPDLRVQRAWAMNLGANAPAEEAGDTPPAAYASQPTVFNAEHLLVESGGVVVRTQRGPLELSLRLEASHAGTAPGEVFPVALNLQVGQGGIGLEGQLGVNPLSFDGALRWNDLAVPPFLFVGKPELLPWLRSCDARGDLRLTLQSEPGDGPAAFTASGTASISTLAFVDPDSEELALEWERLDLEVGEFFWPLDSAAETPPRVDIQRIVLVAPQLVATNPPEALDRLLATLAGDAQREGAGVPAEDDVAGEGASPVVRVAAFELSRGQVQFIDRAVSPTHTTSILDLRFEATGIEAAQPAARSFAVRGLIQGAGHFKLTGKLAADSGDLRFDLDRLDLTSYGSYASQAGWKIRRGKSSLHSSVLIRGDDYHAENEVVLHDLAVDSENAGGFASTFGVPLDLALALLRNPEGDIDLDVPVRWRGGELGVGFRAILLDALKEALTGTLASPLKMMGAVWPGGKGGAASFEPIPIPPGASAPDVGAADRLEAAARLLSERPALAVDLHGETAPADRPFLAERMLQRKAESGDDLPELDDAGFFARRRVTGVLRDRAKGEEVELEPDDQALLERYVEAQPVPDERFAALARARAEAVRAALLEAGAPDEAVRLAATKTAENPGVALQLHPRTAGPITRH